MQMLIYLFAIWENGKEYYKDNLIQAGVFYFQAKNTKVTSDKLERNSEKTHAQSLSAKEHAMDGIILNNMQVFQAMDKTNEGVFLPG